MKRYLLLSLVIALFIFIACSVDDSSLSDEKTANYIENPIKFILHLEGSAVDAAWAEDDDSIKNVELYLKDESRHNCNICFTLYKYGTSVIRLAPLPSSKIIKITCEKDMEGNILYSAESVYHNICKLKEDDFIEKDFLPIKIKLYGYSRNEKNIIRFNSLCTAGDASMIDVISTERENFVITIKKPGNSDIIFYNDENPIGTLIINARKPLYSLSSPLDFIVYCNGDGNNKVIYDFIKS